MGCGSLNLWLNIGSVYYWWHTMARDIWACKGESRNWYPDPSNGSLIFLLCNNEKIKEPGVGGCEITTSLAIRQIFLMLVNYCVRNPGVPTIEEKLIEALSKAEAFPEEVKNNLRKVRKHLQICGRGGGGGGVWGLITIPEPTEFWIN